MGERGIKLFLWVRDWPDGFLKFVFYATRARGKTRNGINKFIDRRDKK